MAKFRMWLDEDGDETVVVIETEGKPTLRSDPMSRARAEALLAQATETVNGMVTAYEPPDGHHR